MVFAFYFLSFFFLEGGVFEVLSDGKFDLLAKANIKVNASLMYSAMLHS